jgi:alpha-tubulin suppressor-like RCC1 family protein
MAAVCAIGVIAFLAWWLSDRQAVRGRGLPRICAGDGHAVALFTDGRILCWGRNEFGQSGPGPPRKDWLNPLVKMPKGTNWTQIATGDNHTLALQADGSLWAWGRNDFGQLGIGIFDPHSASRMPTIRPVPMRIGLETDWVAISGGCGFSIGFKRDGSLWAWGGDWVGQLGVEPGQTMRPLFDDYNGAPLAFKTNRPMRIGLSSDWKAVSAGAEHVLALKSDGSLWAWGRNDCGQLGDGTTEHRSAPVRIGPETNWRSISAGGGSTGGHSVAIKNDGSLWAWGVFMPPTNGQFKANAPNAIRPTCIGDDHDWQQAIAGDGFTMAIKIDGSLWILGFDYVGVGGVPNARVVRPIRVGRKTDWILAAVEGVGYFGDRSQYYAYGLESDGTLWIWGPNLRRPVNKYVAKMHGWLARGGIKVMWGDTGISSPAHFMDLGSPSQ